MSNIHTEVTGQEIQSSSDIFIGEGASLNDPRNIPGFRQTTNFQPKYAAVQQEKKKGKIAKFFSNMSRLGMVYDASGESEVKSSGSGALKVYPTGRTPGVAIAMGVVK